MLALDLAGPERQARSAQQKRGGVVGASHRGGSDAGSVRNAGRFGRHGHRRPRIRWLLRVGYPTAEAQNGGRSVSEPRKPSPRNIGGVDQMVQ